MQKLPKENVKLQTLNLILKLVESAKHFYNPESAKPQPSQQISQNLI